MRPGANSSPTAHRDRLVDMGLAQVFIPSKEREGYERYVEDNLVTYWVTIPCRSRSVAGYGTTPP